MECVLCGTSVQDAAHGNRNNSEVQKSIIHCNTFELLLLPRAAVILNSTRRHHTTVNPRVIYWFFFHSRDPWVWFGSSDASRPSRARHLILNLGTFWGGILCLLRPQ